MSALIVQGLSALQTLQLTRDLLAVFPSLLSFFLGRYLDTMLDTLLDTLLLPSIKRSFLNDLVRPPCWPLSLLPRRELMAPRPLSLPGAFFTALEDCPTLPLSMTRTYLIDRMPKEKKKKVKVTVRSQVPCESTAEPADESSRPCQRPRPTPSALALALSALEASS